MLLGGCDSTDLLNTYSRLSSFWNEQKYRLNISVVQQRAADSTLNGRTDAADIQPKRRMKKISSLNEHAITRISEKLILHSPRTDKIMALLEAERRALTVNMTIQLYHSQRPLVAAKNSPLPFAFIPN